MKVFPTKKSAGIAEPDHEKVCVAARAFYFPRVVQAYNFEETVASSTTYGEEDCLVANVHTSSLPRKSGSETDENLLLLRPVMVFVFGGAYVLGSGDRGTYGAGTGFNNI